MRLLYRGTTEATGPLLVVFGLAPLRPGESARNGPVNLTLVREAKKRAERVVVSIFVNPTQFGANEDFSKYPRTFQNDVRLLSEIGADAVFAPQVSDMYPNGFATTITVVAFHLTARSTEWTS